MTMVFISEDINEKKVKMQWKKTFVNYVSDKSTACIKSCCKLTIKVGPIKKSRQRIRMDISLKIGKWLRRCSTSSAGNVIEPKIRPCFITKEELKSINTQGWDCSWVVWCPTATAAAREERAADVDKEVENPRYFVVGNEMVQLLWKTTVQ